MLENLYTCKYQIRFEESQPNPHFACEEETNEEFGFCIFHDRENYEKNETQAAERFEKKVSESIESGEPLQCVGYFLPYFIFSWLADKKPFAQQVDFRNATFYKNADFTNTIFLKDANFYLATFLKDAYFHGATFSERADFENATFSEMGAYSQAKFCKQANFSRSTFRNNAFFAKTTFSEGADFENATFSGESANFEEAKLLKYANFVRARFIEGASFLENDFSCKTFFRKTRFEQPNKVVIDDNDLSKVSFADTDIAKIRLGDKIKWGEGKERFTIIEEKWLKQKINRKNDVKNLEKYEENLITSTNTNDRENDTRIQDNVAANSTEANISEGDILLQTGKIVRDWESVHHRSLTGKNKDIALKAAYIQLTQKRGIIRSDLYKWYNYNSDYARRKIYLLQKDLGLLVPINDRRSGRFQQYCISTELDRFKEESHASSITNSDSAVKQGEKIGADQFMQTSSTSLIQHLVAALSRKKPTFHKLHLYTKLPPELYGDIDWSVPSTRNKAKVKEFPLEYRRLVGFEIFSDGTTGIHMTSTSNPFELHTPLGIIEFVSSLGEARSILKAECKDLRQIPPVAKWRLKMFDKDKTISLSELEKDIPQVMKWWSTEGIRVEHLGYAFQIYGKVMPETGPAFRLEVQSTVEDKEKDLSEAILEATFPEVKFKTALELLNRRLERPEENNNNP